MSMLIIIIGILIISVVALKLKQQHKPISKINNTKKLAEENGIDADELLKAAGLEKDPTSETGGEVEEDVTEPTMCARYPDESGNCLVGFELNETKCCVLPAAKVKKAQMAMGIGKMAVETAISESAEFIVKKMGKKLADRIAKKLAAETLQEGLT